MNMLSILLYAIYLLGSVKILVGVFAVVTTIVVVCCFIAWAGNSDARQYDHAEWWATRLKKWIKWPIILWAFFVLIPHEQTVKLIAASEVAGYLATTEAGQQVISEVGKTAGKTGEIAQDSLNLLHEYIKKELGTLQNEVKEKVKEKVNKAIEETT